MRAKKTRTRTAHEKMKSRCDNPNYNRSYRYKELDISYDPAWKTFNGFFEDMGECPEDFVLDRIDNNLGYCVENCHWVSKRDSARNREGIKLNVEKVRLIKAMLRASKQEVSLSAKCCIIADTFKVTPDAIRKIADGKNWSEIA